MSYREEDGQVVLTMSREDYDELLLIFATATIHQIKHWKDFGAAVDRTIELLNRLNEGNPNYTPYQVGEPKC